MKDYSKNGAIKSFSLYKKVSTSVRIRFFIPAPRPSNVKSPILHKFESENDLIPCDFFGKT